MPPRVCGACGFASPPEMRYCGNCGTLVAARCSACGFLNPGGYRFCGQCGAGLDPAPGAPPASQLEPPIVSSVVTRSDGPAELPPAASVARTDSAAAPPAADRRNVTILFADVSGSTALAEKTDPEVFTEIMNDLFRRLGQCITRYGGTIDKYIGDNVMALFGAPIAHENDPERAVAAAHDMQVALAQISRQVEAQVGVPLGMRIGINTGEVIAGVVGSSAKLEYTVMGDAVNVASRLEHAASVGKVLVSASTYAGARHAFDFLALDPILVKGKREPLPVFELTGPATRRDSVGGIDGVQRHFVGRADVLSTLLASIDVVQRGGHQIVSIVGDAGIGKSSLLHEARRRATETGSCLRWFLGRCLPYEELNIYGAITTLIREILDLPATASADQQIAALEDRAVSPAAARALGILLEGDVHAVARLYASPEDWRQEVHASLVEIVRAACERGPCAITIEDVHWIDASSLDALTALLDRARGLPLLVSLLYRSEFEAPASWWEPAEARRIVLGPLPAAEVRALLDEIGVLGALDERIVQQLADRSGGVPFYLEEILRSFVDRGTLRREGQGWVADDGIAPDQVPDSVEAVVRARIDRLPIRPQRVLEQAAVIGRQFDRPVLALVSDVQPIEPPLAQLTASQLVAPVAASPHGGRYLITSLMVQEVAYKSLLIRERRDLHRRVAQVLSERDVVDDARVAQHFLAAEDWVPAACASIRAARRARGLHANVEAIELLARAVDAIDRVPLDELADDVRRLRVRALLDRGEVLAILTRYDEARLNFDRALSLAVETGERADGLTQIGEWLHLRKADYAAALDSWQQALLLLPPSDEARPRRVHLRCLLAEVHIRRAEHDLARALLDEALADLDGLDLPKEQSRVWRMRGMAAMVQAQFDEAIECWEQALELARRVDDVFTSAPLVNNLAIAWFRKGQIQRAADWFEQALRDFERAGDSSRTADVLTNLGGVYRGMGQLERSIAMYRQSLAMKERMGDRRGVIRNYVNLGEALRDVGDPASSLEFLEQSLTLARDIGANETEPEIVRQIADSRLAAGDLAGATEAADTALALARKHDNRLEEASALRSLGRLAEREARLEQAEFHLRDAMAILIERGAERELEVTRGELVRILVALGRTAEARREGADAVARLDRLQATDEAAKLRRTLEALGAR